MAMRVCPSCYSTLPEEKTIFYLKSSRYYCHGCLTKKLSPNKQPTALEISRKKSSALKAQKQYLAGTFYFPD